MVIALTSFRASAKSSSALSNLRCNDAFFVSDCGELAPLAYDLQEWIVEQFRQKCLREGPRSDGCRPSDRVREFRHKLKVGVQVAVAAGLRSMIQGAGHAWGNLG